MADPELRHTQSNVAVATYRIAVDRNFVTRDANGNRQSQADFINIVSWRQGGEFVVKYFKKGDMIIVEGQLQSRKYTDSNGNDRVAYEVITDNVNFCGSRREGNASGTEAAPTQSRASAASTTQDNYDDPGEQGDGELPF